MNGNVISVRGIREGGIRNEVAREEGVGISVAKGADEGRDKREEEERGNLTCTAVVGEEVPDHQIKVGTDGDKKWSTVATAYVVWC